MPFVGGPATGRYMKRKAATLTSRPLPRGAPASIRKGVPRSLAARLVGIRRQRTTAANIPRGPTRVTVDKQYLRLTVRCWVVRTLFTLLQIGGKFRRAALKVLFAAAGQKGFRWVETHFASWLLQAGRAEHFLRPFDATSRTLIMALAAVTDEHVVVATVIFLRVVVVEGARARG